MPEPHNAMDSAAIVKKLNKQGRNLVKQGKLNEAIVCFGQALTLDDRDIITLNSYANALVKANQIDCAIQLFERSLELDDQNIRTLNSYANAWVKKGESNRAIQIFERALKLAPNNVITLSTFANLLLQKGESVYATELFERALALAPNDVITLSTFANLLLQKGESVHATELFERALALAPNDVITLNSFANLLVQKGESDRAIELFKRSYKLDDMHIHTLNSYANALVQKGEGDRAIELFERSYQLDDKHIPTLNSYANALVQRGENDRAIQLFEHALELAPDNIITLNSYANLLVQKGESDRAIQLLERSYQLDDKHIPTLNSYANALVQRGENDCAIQLLKRALELPPDNIITIDALSFARLQYAKQLEGQKHYEEALAQLLAIEQATQTPYHANVVRLHLGRIYYLLQQPDLGKQYFDAAIANSDDKNKSRLYAARSLLANNPNSDEAIALLQQIEADSPRYDEAMQAIAISASPEITYSLFAGSSESFDSTEMLYRTIYHKIGNEVAILESIVHRLLRKIANDLPLVSEIVRDLDKLKESIARQRASEKAKIATIPRESYNELIAVIAKTAHDISDEVNNILAAIQSKTQRTLRKLPETSPIHEHLTKLNIQLELTQTALNDLKSINEGIVIRRHRFPVHKLFEKWESTNWSSRPRLQKAHIFLNLENPDAEFDGDEEKIKSVINELVENALKHNPDCRDFSVWLSARDLLNPTDIGMPTIPGDRKYLYIQVSDNGKGISLDKKEWIFEPLNTTSTAEKGSGLGLFITRKSIQKMGGTIRETGEPGKGAKFQIYLPYLDRDESSFFTLPLEESSHAAP